jgi:hypothetical protein
VVVGARMLGLGNVVARRGREGDRSERSEQLADLLGKDAGREEAPDCWEY